MPVPQCSSSYARVSWHDLQGFPGDVEITEMDGVERCVSVFVLRVGCPLQVVRIYLEMIKERPMKV
jgi:hypothetical protein